MLAESFRVRERALRRLSQPTAVELPRPVTIGLPEPTSLALTLGRVFFAVLFILSGAFKLLDLAATAQMISARVTIPEMLAVYTTQLEGMTGMPMAQLLAIAAAAVELVCGLAIALNFGARFFAIVLILFVIVATYHVHDFWNQSGPEQKNNMIHALKNLSLIGALFIIAGIGRGPRNDPSYTDV